MNLWYLIVKLDDVYHIIWVSLAKMIDAIEASEQIIANFVVKKVISAVVDPGFLAQRAPTPGQRSANPMHF